MTHKMAGDVVVPIVLLCAVCGAWRRRLAGGCHGHCVPQVFAKAGFTLQKRRLRVTGEEGSRPTLRRGLRPPLT